MHKSNRTHSTRVLFGSYLGLGEGIVKQSPFLDTQLWHKVNMAMAIDIYEDFPIEKTSSFILIGDFPYCNVHFIKDGIIRKVKLINLVEIRFQTMLTSIFSEWNQTSWNMNHRV